MSFAKCHTEDTGAASWKAATFSMEKTDILSEEEVGVNGSGPYQFVGEALNLWSPLLGVV